MKLLFVGDVVGTNGVNFLRRVLPQIKREMGIDALIVNGENSANGNGVTKRSAEELLNIGADVITTGNHCFQRREAVAYFEQQQLLLRPANYPEGVPGRGFLTLDFGFAQLAVINLQGTLFMDNLDNPFTAVDKILPEITTPNIFVDFHAEATSEKKALGAYLTGKVTAVFGTHTHVQTADERILGGHTAYITDVGMTGAEDSVLGVQTEAAVERLRFHLPTAFKESENAPFLNGVVVTFDEKLGKATKIERVIKR